MKNGTLAQLLVIRMLQASVWAFSEEKESLQNQGHASHDFHRHHIAGVIAATINLDQHHTDLTLGGDYQFRLSKRWAIGGFGEAILVWGLNIGKGV